MPNLWAHMQFGRGIAEELRFADLLENNKWKTAFQFAWLRSGDDEEASRRSEFAKRLGNISYETGRGCDDGVITYAEPVL